MRNVIQYVMLAVTLATPIFIGSARTSSAQSAPVQSYASLDAWTPYMGADMLSGFIQMDAGVQVLDIRRERYVKNGTIPGAIWVPFSEWRGPSERPGQPPTEEQLEALLGDNGIRLDQPIVVHNHAGKTIQNGRAAIVYWLLKTAGAEDIAILNGGFKAWSAAGLPEADAPNVMDAQSIDLSYRRDWWADPLDIFAITSGQEDGAILDARLDGQVRKSVETGEPLKSMPLAQYIPASFFTSHLSAQSLSEAGKSEFMSDLESRGISVDDGLLISVCQTGELSALSWFYASEVLGIENVRYYPDALQGWRSDGGLMFGLNASL